MVLIMCMYCILSSSITLPQQHVTAIPWEPRKTALLGMEHNTRTCLYSSLWLRILTTSQIELHFSQWINSCWNAQATTDIQPAAPAPAVTPRHPQLSDTWFPGWKPCWALRSGCCTPLPPSPSHNCHPHPAQGTLSPKTVTGGAQLGWLSTGEVLVAAKGK